MNTVQRLPVLIALLVCLCVWAPPSAAQAAESSQSRQQALRALDEPRAEARVNAVNRLAVVGAMADVPKLVERLHDDSRPVRLATVEALWAVWGRSGDPAIDRLYRQGVQLMEEGRVQDAQPIFDTIVRRKPAFAEGWNKRATILFLMGDLDASLKDCHEVIRRNPHHFGVLAGYGQIYLQKRDFERALHYFERALAINPNMDGVATTVAALRQMRQTRPGPKA